MWKSVADLHANIVEAPYIGNRLSRSRANSTLLVTGAREHNLHVVLLWFGTWKNGNMHYGPEWVKSDMRRLLRVIVPMVNPSTCYPQVPAPNSMPTKRRSNALGGNEPTVLLARVENESGIIGRPRDFSPESNKEFARPVPAEVLAAACGQGGA